ncbi:hypothetical protein RhiirA1_482763 [Rhizophagus irregularis]|uniref:Uncharacterized protein n=1 Tax=Rhizophagus irregularis TaxID=588596 RepID=A0A2N0QLE5_9GLOM|nr:hypothetical protein RhiirA1_482763 [Rhizophagus irregularis]
MSLTFHESKNISNQHLVTAIVDEIKQYPKLFLWIARLFSIYKKNPNNILSEIYEQAKSFLSLEKNLTEEKIEYLAGKLKSIYELVPDKFSDTRSKILESVTYYFGPVTKGLKHEKCKADIGNVIPKTYAFEKAKKSHQDKLKYLECAYQYLTKRYCEPKIYFACYNMNYAEELNNLQNNWGFNYINFVNPVEILNGKI